LHPFGRRRDSLGKLHLLQQLFRDPPRPSESLHDWSIPYVHFPFFFYSRSGNVPLQLPMEAWLRKRRYSELVYSVLLSALASIAGLGAMALILGVFWFSALLLTIFVTGGKYHSFGWPLALTSFLTAWLFIDSVRSPRDDFSNIPLWLLRESIGIGPRLLQESYHYAQRALQFAQLDVHTCAAVIDWLAAKRHSVSRDELLRAFPDVDWTRLRSQLRLIDGVLILR